MPKPAPVSSPFAHPVSAAAQLLRWKADVMDPPGMGRAHVAGPNGTAMLEPRQTHDDDNVAELYRHAADLLERVHRLEREVHLQRWLVFFGFLVALTIRAMEAL